MIGWCNVGVVPWTIGTLPFKVIEFIQALVSNVPGSNTNVYS